MFLSLLEKIGRKRTLLDRGPSHPEYYKAKPWINRYYILFKKRPKWFPFNIFINEIIDNDHGDGVHNHLFPYISIMLRGGYWETLNNGKYWRGNWYIGFRSANRLHRVDINKENKPITLVINGPYGFRTQPRAEYKKKFD